MPLMVLGVVAILVWAVVGGLVLIQRAKRRGKR